MSVKSEYKYSQLTDRIINLAISVHKTLGPGFVEKIYQRALYLELKNSKLRFVREKRLTIYYKKVNLGYETVDFEIEGKVLIEIKAVSEINDIHRAQLLSYLKSSGCEVGLILNFARLTLEIKRIIN